MVINHQVPLIFLAMPYKIALASHFKSKVRALSVLGECVATLGCLEV